MSKESQNSRGTQRADWAGFSALGAHWPEYCMEGALLGLFLALACGYAVLLEHPSSPVHRSLAEEAEVRRALMGCAMGVTAILLIRSPWGQRSGAHMNPAVTLTFLTLGKIAPWDALFYVLFQFVGGACGVLGAGLLFGPLLRHPAIHSIATRPGAAGPRVAFAAEFVISLLLMMTVLWVSNSARYSRWTPWCAGALVALFITFEAPLSGMSMNPARSFASAFHARDWTAIWIYFVAPPVAMLLASLLYRLLRGTEKVFCAKLHHHNDRRCIFRCRYGELNAQ